MVTVKWYPLGNISPSVFTVGHNALSDVILSYWVIMCPNMRWHKFVNWQRMSKNTITLLNSLLTNAGLNFLMHHSDICSVSSIHLHGEDMNKKVLFCTIFILLQIWHKDTGNDQHYHSEPDITCSILVFDSTQLFVNLIKKSLELE